jgi:dTDP-glucose pyrophosphorylase
MRYKVLITTSGVGSRLGDITKYTNKALVPIGDKPAISYIIENYPKNIEFVVTVGYFAEHVKDFLLLAYPDRKFTFVEIDKYKGEGSSLGYSMLCAKKYLNTPFIFHACDTLIEDKIPFPSKNWIMGFKGDGSSLYASFNVNGKYVEQMMVKGFLNPDFLHIGLVGIKDYKIFFKTLEDLYTKDPNNKELSDVKVVNNMLLDGIKFSYQQVYEWYDTGNVESLQRIRSIKTQSTHILEKDAESIFFFDKFVIKFFFDKTIIDKRSLRATILKDKVPKVEKVQGNFMKYKYVKGELFSDFATPSNFDSFLNWAEKKLWIKTKEVSDSEFKKVCYEFYFT